MTSSVKTVSAIGTASPTTSSSSSSSSLPLLFLSVLSVVIAYVAYQTHLQQQSSSAASSWTASPLFPVIIIGGGFALGALIGKWWKQRKDKKAKPSLDPKEFQKFPLIEKKKISPNTAIYRFGLPSPTAVLGLPIGQHISLMATIDGKDVSRSYTPISSDDDLGYFDLLIKTYPQGNISRVVDDLKIGDTMSVRGPKGSFKYVPNMVREFGMIAGGTGITPMYQIIKAILKNPEDKTRVKLLFANVTETDILMREELDSMAKESNGQFQVLHVLNKPPEDWDGKTGFVSKEMIQETFPAAASDIKVLLCGPPPMIKAMCGHLEELGYEKARALSKLEDMVFKF